MRGMAIEAFLSWAFGEELAKGGGVDGVAAVASAWGKIQGLAVLGAIVDTGDRRDGPTMCLVDGDPHPDAVIAGKAVAALGDLDLEVPDGWSPLDDFPELGDLGEAAVAAATARLRRSPARFARSVVALVVARAVIGLPPDWSMTPVRIDVARHNGAPAWFRMATVPDRASGKSMRIEVDGYDRKRRRPFHDAYRKRVLSRDIVGDVMARADYQIWRAAMDIVRDDILSGRHGELKAHRVGPCLAPLCPWAVGESSARAPRVFVQAKETA